MARTDDDSWDITEGVGATALGVAWARSQEATSECPLFTDPYAEVFRGKRHRPGGDTGRGA
jgi:O-methyltransferase involved in polyketide biosynthesis